MRLQGMGLIAAALLVCGCVPLQQKLQKEQVDQAHYDTQARERAAAQRCDQAAMPGSTEHMVCMLGAAKAPAP